MALIASNAEAWLVAVPGSYVMNALTTFCAESERVLRRKDYFAFVASGILGVIATTAILVTLSLHLHVMVAKLISILAGFTLDLATSNFVVFRARTPKV